MRQSNSPLARLSDVGQSFWLDYIRRGMLRDGTLQRLIDQDGLRGMTSNPAIFEKAIAGSSDYDEQLRELAGRGVGVDAAYEAMVLQDIGEAADQLRPVFDATDGVDGRVSIEVSPRLAHDTQATVEEARRLWHALERPNIMIKVPATVAGLPAIRRLIGDGISVNVTLLFSVSRYAQVLDAYMAGLEDAAAAGRELQSIASVASFFLSRIDTLIDARLDRYATEPAHAVRGEAAVANARLAYAHFCTQRTAARWQVLEQRGARVQRLLWASTSTKDPAYDDLKYVTPLIGPDTVTTLPPETVDAFRDHGQVKVALSEAAQNANEVIGALAQLDIDLDTVADQLEVEGVDKFVQPFDSLMETIGERLRSAA